MHKLSLTKEISHGITFYNSQERNSLYRHPKQDKQKIKKFLLQSSSKDKVGIENARATISDKPLIRNPSVEVLQTKTKFSELLGSTPTDKYEKLITNKTVTDSVTTPRLFPQISPRDTIVVDEPPKFLHHRKNPSVGADIMRLNIPPRLPKEFLDIPSTDPIRRLVSTPQLSDKLFNANNILTDHNGVRISEMKSDGYRISEFASEFKDLYVNSNPAYDLTMPKDSARRKNMIAKMYSTSHDISHLADLKGDATNRRDLNKFVDNLWKENNDFVQKDSRESNLLTPVTNIQPNSSNFKDLKSLFSQSLFDVALRRASDFLTQSASSPKRSEVHSAIKTNVRDNSNVLKKNNERVSSPNLASVVNSPFTTRHSSQGDIKDFRYGTFGVERATTESPEDIGKFSYKSLLDSLKQKLPNVFTDAPSGRTEVVILRSWLKSNVECIKNHPTLNLTEKLHRADEIYSITFKELVRQISCECLERGELLMKVWKNYISLYNGLVSDIKSHFNEKIKSFNEELNRMKDGFCIQLGTKDKEIEALSKAKADTESKCESILKGKIAAELKYFKFEGVTGQLKNQIRTMKKQFEILKKEYEDISYKYGKLRNEMQLEEDEFDPEEILEAKFLAVQSSNANQHDQANNAPYLDSEEAETPLKQQYNHSNQQAVGFGAFVGKKVEYADKETEIEKEAFGIQTATTDVETQTDLILAHSQYDRLLANMEVIEELRKEEILKQEIQEENVQNLEEDLHEEMIEEKLNGMYSKNRKYAEDNAPLSGEVMESQLDTSVYSNEVTSIHFDTDNPKGSKGRRRSGILLIPGQEDSQIDSANYISLNELDNRNEFYQDGLGTASDGSFLETTPKNDREKGQRASDKFKESIDRVGEEESKSSNSKSKDRELQVEIPRGKYSKSMESSRKRLASPKNGKITLQIPTGERFIRDEIRSPILENMDESILSPKTPLKKETEESVGPAHVIQQRISEKIHALKDRRNLATQSDSDTAKFSVTQLQTHVREIFEEETAKNKEQSEEPGSQKIEEGSDQPQGLNKAKYFENIVLNQLKYIRMMKMLKVEKMKTKELEQKQQALILVVNQDEQLLEKIKEVVEEIKAANNDNLDKGKLLKVVKDLQQRKKAVDAIKDSNFLKVNDGLGGDDFIMRADTRSKTQSLSSHPMRSEHRTMTSSKIFDEESKDKKKLEGSQNFVKRRTDQKLTMLKTNFSATNTANLINQGTSIMTNVGAMLGRKREPSTNYKKSNAALEAVNKLGKVLKKGIRVRNLITLKKILKSITSFIIDKMAAGHENAVVREQDMASFIFTSFFNTYGTSKFAESKYLKFMASLKMYTAIHRVATFAKLCGVSDSHNNWTNDEGKLFLLGLEFLLTQKNIGMTIANSETEKRHYTPFVRAVEYLRQFCEKRGIHSEFADLKREIEKVKEVDSTGQNRAGKIKVDLFLEMIVEFYRKYKERSKEHLRWVFEACNFLGRKTLGLDEICVLVKYIEPEKYDPKRLEDVYNLNEEYVDSENTGLTLNKFIVIVLDNDLFSIEKLRRFVLASDDNEVAKNFNSIKEIWDKKRERLEQLIQYNHRFHEPEVLTFWTVALGSFDDEMNSDLSQNKLYLLIKYRILVLEMNATFAANVPFV